MIDFYIERTPLLDEIQYVLQYVKLQIFLW